MKKPLILLITTSLFLLGCGKKEAAENSAVAKTTVTSAEIIYTFDYPDDSEDFPEDHHIVLKEENGKTVGTYYGTSDDFDGAREGYLPGFYAVPMKSIVKTDTELTFSLELTENDLFVNPLMVGKAKDPQNKYWDLFSALSETKREVKGKFVNGAIHIESPEGLKVFKKQS